MSPEKQCVLINLLLKIILFKDELYNIKNQVIQLNLENMNQKEKN